MVCRGERTHKLKKLSSICVWPAPHREKKANSLHAVPSNVHCQHLYLFKRVNPSIPLASILALPCHAGLHNFYSSIVEKSLFQGILLFLDTFRIQGFCHSIRKVSRNRKNDKSFDETKKLLTRGPERAFRCLDCDTLPIAVDASHIQSFDVPPLPHHLAPLAHLITCLCPNTAHCTIQPDEQGEATSAHCQLWNMLQHCLLWTVLLCTVQPAMLHSTTTRWAACSAPQCWHDHSLAWGPLLLGALPTTWGPSISTSWISSWG